MTKKWIVIILLCAAAAAAAFYYFSGGMMPEKNTVAAALKAYQLYTSEEKKREINLYFGAADSDGFAAAKGVIYETPLQVNQVKQAVLLLLAGPSQGTLRVIPEGTILRDVYLDSNGIAYTDFSQELSLNLPGGTTSEYLAVYSVLKTLFDAFPWIKGVRILVDGKETATLSGHLSLEGIFRPE
jgi:spore germination protein GerM